MRDGNRATETADVLLVEDNPGDVRLTQEALEAGEIDSRLHVVTDGIEALDFLFRRADFADAPRPDLVLLDLNLPQKDGDEVLEAIRGDQELRCVPVVVLTSSEAQEDVLDSYTAVRTRTSRNRSTPTTSSTSSGRCTGSSSRPSRYPSSTAERL